MIRESAARTQDMNQSPISPAAADSRERAREGSGQFGTQNHAESGIVDAPTPPTCRSCGVELVERTNPTRMAAEQGTWFDHPAIPGPPSLTGHTAAALHRRKDASL